MPPNGVEILLVDDNPTDAELTLSDVGLYWLLLNHPPP